jgi:hypothetical protein
MQGQTAWQWQLYQLVNEGFGGGAREVHELGTLWMAKDLSSDDTPAADRCA